ncbi:hypothetical protein BKH46_03630 [Helicobacter sp. 12S02634-8]|uniref:outer membrane beta-barrel protein n=1 Tax=Helicobacter sp. 12S02634-8 TaxID=1476199 RepID=UPI000BA5A7AA|nr:outer membrane beta-barrel protein [Helicobacter sp. 12S02634-8]PAF47529.1 hypothetical protein BKH46_03630 [Helicobacter sp. 12S02634-8]
MKKIIFLLSTLIWGLGAMDTELDSLRLAGLEGEINALQEKIIKNGGTPNGLSPNQRYINTHYPSASEEKKQKLLYAYGRADAKSGIFMGINVGSGMIFNQYTDGLYNQTTTTIPDLQSQKTGILNTQTPTGANKPLRLQSSLMMFGGKIGYQSFFNPYFGTRVYGDVMISSGSLKDQDNGGQKVGSVIYMLGALNLDLLLEVPLDKKMRYFIGGFVGVGVGAMLLLDTADKAKMYPLLTPSAQQAGYSSDNVLWNTLLQVDYTFNTGIAVTINTKNRLEIGAKIPWNFLRLGLESPAEYRDKNGNVKVLESKDIEFKRSVIWTASYIYLF